MPLALQFSWSRWFAPSRVFALSELQRSEAELAASQFIVFTVNHRPLDRVKATSKGMLGALADVVFELCRLGDTAKTGMWS